MDVMQIILWGLIILIVSLAILWFFFKSIVAHGVEDGIVNAYLEIEKIKSNPSKSTEDEVKEEMQGWS